MFAPVRLLGPLFLLGGVYLTLRMIFFEQEIDTLHKVTAKHFMNQSGNFNVQDALIFIIFHL